EEALVLGVERRGDVRARRVEVHAEALDRLARSALEARVLLETEVGAAREVEHLVTVEAQRSTVEASVLRRAVDQPMCAKQRGRRLHRGDALAVPGANRSRGGRKASHGIRGGKGFLPATSNHFPG